MMYLGLDWGLKRIGLAISAGEIAQPLQTITVHSFKEAVDTVMQIASSEGSTMLVIGKPEGAMGKAVDRAVKEFRKKGVEIVVTDETLSTRDAQELMREIGVGQKGRHDDNSYAAALILQRYLDKKK